MTFRPTIGLEVHAELKTKTKMFCDSRNDPEETRPNVNVCPVCLAHPGTLPVMNKEAVRHVLRVGRALRGTLADYSEFDRKSYFYPDIPKGYQISQYEYPLVAGGELSGVAVTRVHLEEDTARSSHAGGKSLVDFNRAGVPLMELVTEPVIHDAATAGKFARELQLLLRTLGASDANLEKGEMRIEANISVSADPAKLGTKVEVKNLNSFRSVERAIEFEVARQAKLIESGGKVEQETRGWDESKQETFRQRVKEGSADYRYFPEPDLPKLKRSLYPEFSDAALDATLPELPDARRARYAALGVPAEAVEYLAALPERSSFFDRVLGVLAQDPEAAKRAANYIVSDLAGWYAQHGGEPYANIAPESFAELIRMTMEGKLSSRGAKDVLAHLAEHGGSAADVAKREGLLQVSDTGALEAVVGEVIKANDAAVVEYRSGKDAALQYLLGQAMKASKGAGNPQVLRKLLVKELGRK
ncbi:Asp-tRNA(Asn)/Glu-tRNA(Gln) amidotransferase subunit GatB [Patescibacteria group bacterium]|nr:Asp-tRNA(Asn)/Glu-tRNA(Gln) amidotransferase subunit GatB [Patescibacteria group bacterium]